MPFPLAVQRRDVRAEVLICDARGSIARPRENRLRVPGFGVLFAALASASTARGSAVYGAARAMQMLRRCDVAVPTAIITVCSAPE